MPTESFQYLCQRTKKEEKKKGKESKVRPDAVQCVQGGGRLTRVQENTPVMKSSKAALGVCHYSDNNNELFKSV